MSKVEHIDEVKVLNPTQAAALPTPDVGYVKTYRSNDGYYYEKRSNGQIFKITDQDIFVQVGGQFLCDPNEYNGWGVQGFSDDTNTLDLGNVGATNLSRLAGGISFPFEVELIRYAAWHRNNNNAVEAWGWMISRQEKAGGVNGVQTEYMLDESFDRGVGQFNLRDYGNTVTQRTVIDRFVNNIIPAEQVITLAVGAPTAINTNRYVQIMSGYLQFRRLG